VNEEGASGVRSVSRAIDLLSLVANNSSGVTLGEAVQGTGLPKTTVLRLLQTLEAHGMLWNIGSQTYVPGPGLLHLSSSASDAWRLPPEMARMLDDLAHRVGETVNAWVRDNLTRVCVAHAEAQQSLRHVIRVGAQRPLSSGASAKVLLAAAGDDVVRDVAAISDDSSGLLQQLREAVAEVNAQGWALSHGEREEGLSAVAVPIRSPSGNVVAALTLSGPTGRFTADRIDEFLRELRACADMFARRGSGSVLWNRS